MSGSYDPKEKLAESEPVGLFFAEEPRVVSAEMMTTSSQWISNPNTKEWDYDDD